MEYGLNELELDRRHLRCQDSMILLVFLSEFNTLQSIRRTVIFFRNEHSCLALIDKLLTLVHCNNKRSHSDPCCAEIAYFVDLKERIELA